MPRSEEPHSHDDLVNEAIAAYLEAVERGEPPDRDRFLAQHADVAQELNSFFADQAHFANQARFREAAGSAPASDPNPLTMKMHQRDAPSRKEVLHYFGDYELVEEVARGGMGVVFKARQVTLNRLVAVKMILGGQLARPEDVQRFHTEAEAAAQLDHPGIVPIYEVGEQNGQHYFSMAFVEGQSLARRVAEGPLQPRAAAEIVKMVAEAVQYAHDKGVIHRDLKPGNILLDFDGRPKITDFGLAKITESASDLTGTGQILGTPGYMSPEQASAHGTAVGRLSDVYSLGAILYCLLTARPPFQAANPLETLVQVQTKEPLSPKQLNPHLPLDLDTIALKCLDKSPARRYASAKDLAEELNRYLEGRPIQARPVGWPERTWRWCRRNPAVAGLLTTVAAGLIMGTAVSTYFAIELGRRADENSKLALKERNALQREREAHQKEKAAHQKTDRALYDATVNLARAVRTSRGPGQRFQTLQLLADAKKLGGKLEFSDEDRLALRNQVIACMALPDVREIYKWPGWPVGTVFVALDGRQQRYARMSRHGAISVRAVEGDREIVSLNCDGGPSRLHFSHNGRYLAYGNDDAGKVLLWDLETTPPRCLVDERPCPWNRLDFSPDDRLFVFADSSGRVSLVDLPSGNRLQPLNLGPNPRLPVFHPVRRQLAVACGANLIRVCKLDTGEVIAELPQSDVVRELAWDPDGRILATTGSEMRIRLWDVTKRDVTKPPAARVLEDRPYGGLCLDFSPAGDLLASHDWSNTLRLWDPRTGRQVFQTSFRASLLRFGFEGDRLGGSDPAAGTVGLFEVAPGREYRTFVQTPTLGSGIFYSAAVSPDGRLLVAGMDEGLGFWDFVTGNPLEHIASGRTTVVKFETGGALLTKGDAGLLRWTFASDPAAPATFHVSAPERILPPSNHSLFACTPDGQVVASAQAFGGIVWRRSRPAEQVTLGPHADARYIALSPDGMWVATGSHNGTGVKIWSTTNSALHQDLISEENFCNVGFSPNGQWLVTTGGGCRLWEFKDGDCGAERQIGGGAFAFSHDSRLLAVETGRGTVRLIDPATGREFAQFEDPNQDTADVLAFSPDDRHLVTMTQTNTRSMHDWDLSAIRQQLAERRLDWDLPPFALNREASQTKIDGGAHGVTEWGLPYRSSVLPLSLLIDNDAVRQAIRQ